MDAYPPLMNLEDLKAGLIIRLAPRYDGSGRYAHDNGAGQTLRLIRPMTDGMDWYCTADLFSVITDCAWDAIVHVSRLIRSQTVAPAPAPWRGPPLDPSGNPSRPSPSAVSYTHPEDEIAHYEDDPF